MTNRLTRVPFHGDVIEATQDEGGVWISLRRCCESLGVDPARQREKLKAKAWAVGDMKSSTGPDGKQYEMFMLHLDALPMWLATIEPSRVKPEVRPKLETYQKEAARVLADHFLRKPEPVIGRGELREVIASEIRNVLGDLHRKQAEPMFTILDRLRAVGWYSASPRQRDQIRRLALAKLARHGFPRPDREGTACSAELLFPASQCHLLDEAILQIWDEAHFNERGGMFESQAN